MSEETKKLAHYLRCMNEMYRKAKVLNPDTLLKAADELERLAAEVERLKPKNINVRKDPEEIALDWKCGIIESVFKAIRDFRFVPVGETEDLMDIMRDVTYCVSVDDRERARFRAEKLNKFMEKYKI